MRKTLLLSLLLALVGAGRAARCEDPPKRPAPSASQWEEAEVSQVYETAGGWVVRLRTKNPPRRIVPIAIGFAEALAIQIKLVGRSYIRPLTHDLLESLVQQLGAKVVKVRIEKLESVTGHTGGTFFARVFVRQGKRQFDLDARASDSIAVALRAGVPIYVSTSLVESTGMDARQVEAGDDVERAAPQSKSPRPGDPL